MYKRQVPYPYSPTDSAGGRTYTRDEEAGYNIGAALKWLEQTKIKSGGGRLRRLLCGARAPSLEGFILTWLTLHSRAFIRCCAAVLAQHFGQNIRFAQPPPRGWLRAAQHTTLSADLYSRQARFLLLFFFSPELKKKINILFLIRRRPQKSIRRPFCNSP